MTLELGSVERKKQEAIIEPENPGQFLSELFQNTPDQVYSPADVADATEFEMIPAKFTAHREKIGAALAHIGELARDIVQAYRIRSESIGISPERVRVYLVGGRVRQKPFSLNSDLDIIITTTDTSKSLHRDRESGSNEENKQKLIACKQLLSDLRPILSRANLLEVGPDRTSSWLEIKGFGQTDSEFRSACERSDETEAVLVYSE